MASPAGTHIRIAFFFVGWGVPFLTPLCNAGGYGEIHNIEQAKIIEEALSSNLTSKLHGLEVLPQRSFSMKSK